MNTILPTISAQALPGYALTADQNGLVITTEWTAQPVIPTKLPDGFSCTIINYSNTTFTSNTLATAMFILPGTISANAVSSFSLKPGQSCVLTAASMGNGSDQR